jgi:hypothetical protein
MAWRLLAACEFDYRVVPVPTAAGGEAGSTAGTSAGSPMELPDACLTKPCLHDGRCIPVDDSFVCLCADGFRGDSCEINFDDCDPDPCQNGGTCVDGADTSFCECADGWDGATCQHSVDDCAASPCQNGGSCVDGFKSYTCNCQPGYLGTDCRESLRPTCLAIHDSDPTTTSGVFTVDPDGPGQGNPPLEVLCDMDAMGGGWTRVGEEKTGDVGTFKFLGISLGDPSRSARDGESGLFGEQFQGLYDEVRLGWARPGGGDGAMYFRINEEVFANNVRKAMPLSSFSTTDGELSGWVSTAGGAVLCRASESPGVRPGDSSWAIKPKDDTMTGCGCNSSGWAGHGAYYGGHSDPTYCNASGGGWAGVADNGEPKGDVEGWELQIWIR